MISDKVLESMLINMFFEKASYGSHINVKDYRATIDTGEEEFDRGKPFLQYAWNLGYISRTPSYYTSRLCSLNCTHHAEHRYALTKFGFDLLAPLVGPDVRGRDRCVVMGRKRLQRNQQKATGRRAELLRAAGEYADAQDKNGSE
jgi:hypothetical protein